MGLLLKVNQCRCAEKSDTGNSQYISIEMNSPGDTIIVWNHPVSPEILNACFEKKRMRERNFFFDNMFLVYGLLNFSFTAHGIFSYFLTGGIAGYV